MRLEWIGHYKKHKNASVTCRRFGISRSTLYKWVKSYIERSPRGLEGLSRSPKRRRTSAIPWQTIDLVVSMRTAQPAWSKHKIPVIPQACLPQGKSTAHPYRDFVEAGLEKASPARGSGRISWRSTPTRGATTR